MRTTCYDHLPTEGAPSRSDAQAVLPSWRLARGSLRAIARAVQTLPPRQRMAALLHWHDGLTGGKIASVMEISDRVARKLIADGLVKLRTALSNARAHRE